MPLLELPPEIFGKIIRVVVNDEGVTGSWHLRGVSRAFHDAIKFETFRRQGDIKFRGLNEQMRRIYETDIGLYLYYRARQPKKYNKDLPRCLYKMVSYLSEELHLKSENQLDTILRNVCRGIGRSWKVDQVVKHLRKARKTKDTDFTSQSSPLKIDWKLIAVISQGASSLLTVLLLDFFDHESPGSWKTLLEYAATHSQTEMVTTILARLVNLGAEGKIKMRTMVEIIYAAIHAAIRVHEVEAIRTLVACYTIPFPGLSEKQYWRLLERALDRGLSVVTIKLMRSMPLENEMDRRIPERLFEKTIGNAKVREVFLETIDVDLASSKSTKTPLTTAVLSDGVRAANKLLNAGINTCAVADNIKSVSGNELGIESIVDLAVRTRNPEMVTSLLKAGNAIPHPARWPCDSSSENIFNILREAKIRESGKNFPKFKAFRLMPQSMRNLWSEAFADL